MRWGKDHLNRADVDTPSVVPAIATADDLRAAILAMIERLPISVSAGEGTLTFVDNGTANWPGSRRVQAKFEGGQWVKPNGQPLSFSPTYWVRIKPLAKAGAHDGGT